jgi:long-chain acyl-CoA synthetase
MRIPGVTTLIDLVASAAETFGDQPALVLRAGLRDEVWSYRRLWQASNAIAQHLIEQGICPGQRVLLWGPNSPRYVAGLLGIMQTGAIAVPFDQASPLDLIERVAVDTESSALISDRPLNKSMNLPDLMHFSIDSLPCETDGRIYASRLQPSDVAEIIYTSGTTGKPKGVVLSHANIVASIHSAQALVPCRQPWRLLSLLPLSHMFEQTIGLFEPLSIGACIHYGVSRQSAAIRRAMQRYHINVLVVVPRLLSHMLQGMEREVRRAGRWPAWGRAHRLAPLLPLTLRRCLFRQAHRQLGGALDIVMCGGAYLPPELELAWERLGVRVIQGYGASECAPLIAGNSLDQRLPGSVGRAAPGVQLRLAEGGEILVKGENVFSGYWRNEAASREVFDTDAWYRTGDLGELNAQGQLTIKGRKKDMVVLPTGMNVFLEDIEDVLARQHEIQGCVVLDVARPGGEVGFTAVILADKAADRAAVETAVRNANLQLASHQRVSGLALWEQADFPRTTIGKLKRHEVRAWLDRKSSAVQEDAASRGSTDPGALQSLLSELSGIAATAIFPESDLDLDLGLSSLARVELALLLEETFGVLIEDSDLAQVKRVAQLAALVEQGGSVQANVEIPVWPLEPSACRIRTLLQHLLLFSVHRLVARPFRVEGLHYLQDLTAPALFIANHSSHVDTVSVIRALPKPLRERLAVAAAADYFYRVPSVGRLTSLLMNTFPFSRESAVRTSLEHCGRLADQGWSTLIYPEGTRSTTGELLPFKLGVGLLAAELHVPVVPVAVFGGRDVLPKGCFLPRPGPLWVRFGAPIRIAEGSTPASLAIELRDKVAMLLNVLEEGTTA